MQSGFIIKSAQQKRRVHLQQSHSKRTNRLHSRKDCMNHPSQYWKYQWQEGRSHQFVLLPSLQRSCNNEKEEEEQNNSVQFLDG